VIFPVLPIRKYGKPDGRYRCRTVHTEQPSKRATSVIASGSPKMSGAVLIAHLAPSGNAAGSTARGEIERSPTHASVLRE
jgi:hypothetical protein